MESRQLSEIQQKIIAAAAFGVFLLVMAVLGWFVGLPIVRFAREPELFRAWVENMGPWGRLAYMGMVLLQILVALIPGEALEIVGGYAFGAVEGSVLCLLAAAIGSLAVFALVRRFGVKLFEVFFSLEKLRSLRFLQASRKRDLLFFLVFMIPGTPKDLLCYFAGLTDIRPGTFLFIASVGRIPSIISSTLGGDALGTERYIMAGIVFAATLIVSGIGMLVYRRLSLREKG